MAQVNKKHLFFGLLLLLGCLSFWFTHQTTTGRLNPLPPTDRHNELMEWFTTVTDTGKNAEIDRTLRSATDGMELTKLRSAIEMAENAKYKSPALKTAQFVLQHLSEAHSADLTRIAEQQGHVTTTEGKGDGIARDDTKSNPSTTTVTSTSTQTTSTASAQEKQLVVPGTPKKFDWWSNPPAKIAPYLPPFEQATSAEKLTEDPNQAIKRHDAIIANADPKYHPSKFPIGIVAYNRPELLKLCLESLLGVRGVTREQVTLYLDGSNAAVKKVADDAGVTVKQHMGNENQYGQEGARQIARHYKWTFSALFDDHPDAEYAIVVEDDMIFAPDFMTYFTQLAPLYEADPSIYCITSWNDNAQSGLALDPRVILRTDFFIGLGWMISRKIYKGELEAIWPATHWDHWLRDPARRKNRQCIYPEVTRNFNIGKRGTHSDDNLYAQYFERIVMNKQPAVWLGDTTRLLALNYEPMMITRLKGATQLSSLDDIDAHSYEDLAIFIHTVSTDDRRWEKTYAPYFGLWHSVPNIRGLYNGGLMLIRWKTNYLFIVLSHAQTFALFRQPGTTILEPASFQVRLSSLTIIRSYEGGENCHDACRRHSSQAPHPLECTKAGMIRINDCSIVQQHFSCTKCELNYGVDQPAQVTKPDHQNKGVCLVNSQEPECSGGHADTTRLCACTPTGRK